MKKGMDIVAIAIWAVYTALLPDKYFVFGELIGVAVLAAFLTLYTKRTREEEIEDAVKMAVGRLDVEETVKRKLYNELTSFLRSRKRGVYARIFRVGGNR
ncbi:hypothetical protein [Thermococcus sp.]|uniref:hypothetical protein n=1 Tax=Thermococcus sp. TaxID=35749 RepID=UPI00260695CC|nr:hypothetical protein [Thermococcus sp.]